MPTRLFLTERLPGGITERWYSDEAGNITRKLHQDATDIVKGIAKVSEHPGKNMRLLGSVPNVLALEWSQKIGHPISSPEWLEYAKKQLMSSDFRSLSTGVKI